MTISVTIIIIIITCLVSIPAFTNRQLFDQLKHHPYTEKREKQYHRWLTSGFLHGSWMHIGFNMYVMYGFGQNVERYYQDEFGTIQGSVLFLLMYLLTIILAATPTYFKHQNNPSYSAIGASGGVSGVLFAYMLFDPWNTVSFIFLPSLRIPIIILGILYLFYESWAAKNSNDNIGHDAHFWGAIAGFLITVVLKPSLFSEFLTKLVDGFPL